MTKFELPKIEFITSTEEEILNNNLSEIVDQYTKMYLTKKEQILTQKVMEKLNNRIKELEEQCIAFENERKGLLLHIDELEENRDRLEEENKKLKENRDKAIQYLKDNHEYQEDLCDECIEILKKY